MLIRKKRIIMIDRIAMAGLCMYKFLAMFLSMFTVWIICSGEMSNMIIGLGILSSLLVSWFCLGFLPKNPGDVRLNWGVPKYLAWLFLESMCAALYMLLNVLQRNMLPAVNSRRLSINNECNDNNDLALAILSLSITFTPGTLTARVLDKHSLMVVSFDNDMAESLLSGDMSSRVCKLFS